VNEQWKTTEQRTCPGQTTLFSMQKVTKAWFTLRLTFVRAWKAFEVNFLIEHVNQLCIAQLLHLPHVITSELQCRIDI